MSCKNVIGTKWVFKNKQDEHGIVVRNKARLVAQGYSQMKELTLVKPMLPWLALSPSVSFLLTPIITTLNYNKWM